ncbi:LamG domain-containing protein [Catellatospora chokoriensis]|uniref:LamG-like jellyroll fold domain-containing protein n=1 Tax=Catellatospora chokoriensis TaxID=310353 RepID=A0A8J3KC34_9ACTN|nr:LamG domain-containing protein [Catellatospora chokoriensis]GIF92379.1 hypothetical protein Cch02nite_58230 [Catellatospora chokoriensis]
MMRRLFFYFCAAALLLPAVPATAAPPASPAACAEQPTAPEAAQAAALAAACDRPVEIEAARTEYAEVYAEPSGTRTVVSSLVPQRARTLDGRWGSVDPTLVRIGQELAPTAIAAQVRFSTGGSGPFVTMRRDGHTFSLSWPTALPAPVVSGDSAVYREVLPGADLVVRATAEGFVHLLRVRTRQAATDPRVRDARYVVGGDAVLEHTADGGLRARVGQLQVAAAQAPVMWDTPAVGRSGRELALIGLDREPARRVAAVTGRVSGRQLLLSPDRGLLDDPAARFPIEIDPLFISGVGQWAYASEDNQNGNTMDSKIAAGDPNPAAVALRVGNDPDSTHQYRTFLRFTVSEARGRQILSAKIAGRVDHTWKCGENRSNYFYRTDGISATPRQGWPGPALRVKLGSNSVHANEADCGEANMPFEVSSGTLVGDLQAFADGGQDYYFVGVAAAEDLQGTNDRHTERYMRYFLNDFKLHVTYNTRPNKPDSLTVDGKACATGANRPFVKTVTPTLRARVTDNDGDTMQVWYAYAKWNGASFVDLAGGYQDGVPNGGTSLLTTQSLTDGGVYTFRAQSNDSPSHSPSLASDVTGVPGSCEWQVDVSPPAVPTVTGDVYKEGPTGCSGGACGGVGKIGRFTFSSSADTQHFLWGFTSPPQTVATPQAVGGSVSVDFTPTSSGPRTLYVRAVDRAGNESNRTYQFYVAAQSTALGRWRLDEPAGSTVLVDDTGQGRDATLTGGTLGVRGRIAPGNDGARRTALRLDGIDDMAATAGPVLADTSQSFSVAAWVNLRANTASSTAVAQVGAHNGAFLLEYSQAWNVWKMTAPSTDSASPAAWPGPISTSTPRLNVWTHLAGVYDATTREMRLYVNGVLEGTATGVSVWDADGPLHIGQGMPGTAFAGSVAEVEVWERVISATEVFDLADPVRNALVARWDMSDVGPGPTYDASALAHDLDFFPQPGGPQIPPAGAGHTGTGMLLDGVDDHALTTEPVLRTDQSFTVSAWAYLPAGVTGDRAVFCQQGVQSCGIGLRFDAAAGRWQAVYGAPDGQSGSGVRVQSAAAPARDAWTQLVAVYDAQRAELRLYVNGTLQGAAAVTSPWSADGPVNLGRMWSLGAAANHWQGYVDEIRVYQGVVADLSRIP